MFRAAFFRGVLEMVGGILRGMDVCGVRLDAVTKAEVLARARGDERCFVVTLNPEMVVAAQGNEEFRRVVAGADMVVPDGTGLLWAREYGKVRRAWWELPVSLVAYLFSREKAEVITGTDVLVDMVREVGERGVFFLGAGEGVAARAAEKLRERFPLLRIAGVYAGAPQEREEIVRRVAESGAEVVFAAYGAVRQELLLAEVVACVRGVRVAMGVGGAFDFHAGEVMRAPAWMRRLGLEWLFRLVRQPARAGRIWTAVVTFPLLVHRRSGAKK